MVKTLQNSGSSALSILECCMAIDHKCYKCRRQQKSHVAVRPSNYASQIHGHFISDDYVSPEISQGAKPSDPSTTGPLAPDRIALAFFTESISWRLTTDSCTLTPKPCFVGRPCISKSVSFHVIVTKLDVWLYPELPGSDAFSGSQRFFIEKLNHFYSTNLKLSRCHADLWESDAILIGSSHKRPVQDQVSFVKSRFKTVVLTLRCGIKQRPYGWTISKKVEDPCSRLKNG